MSRTNKVILIGRIGKDPEVRKTATGSSVLSASFVTEDSYKDKSGQYQKTSEWHNLSAFGSMADAIVKNCGKGSALIVEGHLHTSSWDDKASGSKRYKTEIIVESWLFQQGSARKESGESEPASSESESNACAPIDDDLAF